MPSQRLLNYLFLTACALILTIGAVFFLKRPAASSKPFAQALTNAERIEVVVGTTTLALTKAPPIWNVSVDLVGPYKAESTRFQTFQTELTKIEVEDVISESGNNAADFKLNPEDSLTVKVFGKDKALLAGGVFGKRADDGSHTYFRYPDKKPIYLARGSVQARTNILEWRDPVLMNAPEDHVLTLIIQGPHFETTLIRTTDTWRLNDQIIDQDPVWKMLGVLAHLRTEEFVDLNQHPELASKTLHYATILIQLKEGSTQTLHIGKLDAKTKRFPVSLNDEPSVGWIPESTIKSVLKKPSDFRLSKSSSPAASSNGSKPGLPANGPAYRQAGAGQ